MNLIAETAVRLMDDHQAFVLATIINRQGSAPRTAGTRMLVTSEGRAVGTIGGGLLEARVIETAGNVRNSRCAQVVPFDMTQSELAAMDMICGGRLEVLLEFIDPRTSAATVLRGWREAQSEPDPCFFLTELRFAGDRLEGLGHALLKNRRIVCGELSLSPAAVEKLACDHSAATRLQAATCGGSLMLIDPVISWKNVYLFGAGHVAQPTARLAALVGFHVRVVDDRSDFACTERFAEADEIRVVTDFDSALKGLGIDRSAFIVIVTRGHLHDKTVLMQALRTEAAYIGMIGSRRKRDYIFNALLKQGFSETDLKRVHSPIGLDIGAETPEEIALSIVAELVQTRAQRRRS